jgi:predicted nuclease of restriction endonuclease-like (RecB) superfamily
MEKKFQSWSRQPNCYSNIKMRTNMAEQAAENNCYTIVRKKVAELAAPTKLLFNL